MGITGTGCSDFTGSSIDFGLLSTSAATTKTAMFSVKNYTSHGYAVTIVGAPPSYGGNPLNGMGRQIANSTDCGGAYPSCSSQAGVEQFGMNMRANTSPVTFGADPVPLPSGSFSVSDPSVVIPLPYRTGGASPEFRYFAGDTIASAPQSSGETTYTVAFLANISTVTPGGKYTGALEFVVTGTY